MAEEGKLQKYWEGFPEAPASDTFKWVDSHGFVHMTTIRAWAAASLLDFTAEFCGKVLEQGGKPLTDDKPVRPDAPTRSEMPQTADGKKPYTEKPVPQSELPDDLPGASEGAGEYFKHDFDYFVVEPKPDNKATVKFYKDGLKWPVGAPINNWKAKSVQEALFRLGEIDVSKAQTVRVAGTQFYTYGNEYTKPDGTKGRYKDFRGAYSTF